MTTPLRRLRVAGSGLFLPAQMVTAGEMDARLGVPQGWVSRKTGVERRHFMSVGDTAADMGRFALERALRDAHWKTESLDLVICASGTAQQPIPCTAALISEAVGPALRGVPCFDINATCLSCVVALDIAAHLLDGGRHQRIAIVSTETASKGLDWTDPASAALFGDGAVAVLLEATTEAIGVESFRLETYPEGAHHCEIAGGGSALPAMQFSERNFKSYQFHMDGEKLHRLAVRYMPDFVSRLFEPLAIAPRDLDLVIPHQAGKLPLQLLARRLGICESRMVMTFAEHGNTIAAGMPMALHLARQRGHLRSGHRIALLGTGAGLSFAGCVWQW
jgi:3-oxoacyl-[acyl-carrier-protein] synthase-3